ncbi:MAG TPA: hypothetical protein VHV49_00875 [Pseudonocardiaceae bacterium]|nr:hypothetical protein [Pseudonocardiaceae bacterium]
MRNRTAAGNEEHADTVLGSAQPWVLMPLRAARALSRQGGADEVVLDPATADERTRWTPADLRTCGPYEGTARDEQWLPGGAR